MHLLNNLLFFHVSASAFHHISNLQVVLCLCPELFPFCWELSSLTTPEGALGPAAEPLSAEHPSVRRPQQPWGHTVVTAGHCWPRGATQPLRPGNSSLSRAVLPAQTQEFFRARFCHGLVCNSISPINFFFYSYFHFPFTLECFLISKGVLSSAGAF